MYRFIIYYVCVSNKMKQRLEKSWKRSKRKIVDKVNGGNGAIASRRYFSGELTTYKK